MSVKNDLAFPHCIRQKVFWKIIALKLFRPYKSTLPRTLGQTKLNWLVPRTILVVSQSYKKICDLAKVSVVYIVGV